MRSFTTSRFPVLPIRETRLDVGSPVSIVPGQLAETADEALVKRIQIGDGDALALLFRRYAHRVKNIGQRVLRDTSEADDLIQEVFLYIHRRSGLFDRSKGSARSWIFQVAYTQALIRRRQLRSHGFYASAITDNRSESSPPTT